VTHHERHRNFSMESTRKEDPRGPLVITLNGNISALPHLVISTRRRANRKSVMTKAKPPLRPFDESQRAVMKVQLAEDAWNSRDPANGRRWPHARFLPWCAIPPAEFSNAARDRGLSNANKWERELELLVCKATSGPFTGNRIPCSLRIRSGMMRGPVVSLIRQTANGGSPPWFDARPGVRSINDLPISEDDRPRISAPDRSGQCP